jgi:hypothetical protein
MGQPAALSAPHYHAFTIPGEPYGVGESSLRAFLRCLTWSAESVRRSRGTWPHPLIVGLVEAACGIKVCGAPFHGAALNLDGAALNLDADAVAGLSSSCAY